MSVDEDDIGGQYFLHVRYEKRPYRISSVGLFPNKAALLRRDSTAVESVIPKDPDDIVELLTVLRSYNRIRGYAQSGDAISSELNFLPKMRFAGVLDVEGDNLGTIIRLRKNSDLYLTHNLDVGLIQERLDHYRSDIQFSYAIRQSIYVGLVAIFDQLLSKPYATILKLRPSILLSMDRTVPLRDVATAQDFEAFQQKLVEDVIQEQLWKGRIDQIRWFEKFLGKKSGELSSELPSWYDFIVACERRNLYAHHDGLINQEYINRITSTTGTAPKSKIGRRVRVTKQSFQEASDSLMETYIIISQYVVRKLCKSADQSTLEEFDTIYNNAVYEQLKAKRFASAVRLAQFPTKSNFKLYDLSKKMLIINLAIAHDKLGEEKKRDAALDSVDWSSSRDEFNICVAAIKGDIDKVCRLAPRLKGSDLVNPMSYFSWPAFDNVRSKPEFWAALEPVYGDEIKRSAAALSSVKTDVKETEALAQNTGD